MTSNADALIGGWLDWRKRLQDAIDRPAEFRSDLTESSEAGARRQLAQLAEFMGPELVAKAQAEWDASPVGYRPWERRAP